MTSAVRYPSPRYNQTHTHRPVVRTANKENTRYFLELTIELLNLELAKKGCYFKHCVLLLANC
jgi:hypothetical protein